MGLARLAKRSSSDQAALSFPDWQRLWTQFTFDGVRYVLPAGGVDTLTALQGMKSPIVAAAVMVRMMVFSEIRFQWQFKYGSNAGKLFGNKDLSLLEHPWPGATTRDLLAQMEVDASFWGNSYWVKSPDGNWLNRIEPTKISILTGDVHDHLDTATVGKQLVAYGVHDKSNKVIATYLPDEIIHYKPIPDPQNMFRGISWISTILPDISADLDMTAYKQAFLRNAATPNLVVKMPLGMSEESMGKFKDIVESRHTSPDNAFKTLYVGSGVDIQAVGANFGQMNFDAVQSQGETRIAAASGVPASLLGIAEGLKGSSLNSGNFSATRRRFADGTLRSLWTGVSGAIENLIGAPDNCRLWYSDKDVPFLQQDEADAADIRSKDAVTMQALVSSGYDPDSVVAAITNADWTQLQHTGLYSVQLQPPHELMPGSPLPVANPNDEQEPPSD